MLRHVIISFLQVTTEILDIYFYALFIRIVISWFPDLSRNNPAIEWLYTVVDPYLVLFRNTVPLIGSLDISPILAFLFLNLTHTLLDNVIIMVMQVR
uniref:YGGT family, conserved hypothetical integral membrane protein n=1 Tax=Paulinella longichromatophora TaxID=1708747 RepID=A0A2H4ZNQ3_9EUKA|nr:YGGT family, conserved hypothetical integral membrane protein [Paulinella longichromatophora]